MPATISLSIHNVATKKKDQETNPAIPRFGQSNIPINDTVINQREFGYVEGLLARLRAVANPAITAKSKKKKNKFILNFGKNGTKINIKFTPVIPRNTL